jgi:hypothetical protein
VEPSAKPRERPRASTGATGRRNEQSGFHANPRDAECGDDLLNGDEMMTEAQSQSQSQSQDRDREATTGRFPTTGRFSTTDRFPLALFVVVELLCTGALVASVILWM